MLVNVLRPNVFTAHSNDYTELNLVMNVIPLGLHAEGTSWSDHRRHGLVAPHRLCRDRIVQLDAMSAVVATNA